MYDYDCFIHKYLCKKDKKNKYELEYRYKNAFILFTLKKVEQYRMVSLSI